MRPPELLTFAIGDIHGCNEALSNVLRQCHDYAGDRARRYVFIGDYIDRGPDSCAVVDAIKTLVRDHKSDVVCLMGNHEELLLAALDEGDSRHWLANGGDETLSSYGVRTVGDLPIDDVAWLRSLPLSYDDGERFFVHAGIDPLVPLAAQERDALLWIREPFLSSTRDFGQLIVHGHSPLRSGRADLRPNRLNIDTGCVYGGVLTAAIWAGSDRLPRGYITASQPGL